jgi:hypothetical protein
LFALLSSFVSFRSNDLFSVILSLQFLMHLSFFSFSVPSCCLWFYFCFNHPSIYLCSFDTFSLQQALIHSHSIKIITFCVTVFSPISFHFQIIISTHSRSFLPFCHRHELSFRVI